MLHSALGSGEIHVPYNWTFADADARESATGIVAGDVGKFAFQSDDGSIWRLVNHDPLTWKRVDYAGLRYYATSEGLSGTTDETWQEKLSLDVPSLPPGVYALHYSAEIAMTGGGRCAVQVEIGDYEWGSRETDNSHLESFAGFLPAQSETPTAPFSVDMNFKRSNGAGTAYIYRARLFLEWLGA